MLELDCGRDAHRDAEDRGAEDGAHAAQDARTGQAACDEGEPGSIEDGCADYPACDGADAATDGETDQAAGHGSDRGGQAELVDSGLYRRIESLRLWIAVDVVESQIRRGCACCCLHLGRGVGGRQRLRFGGEGRDTGYRRAGGVAHLKLPARGDESGSAGLDDHGLVRGRACVLHSWHDLGAQHVVGCRCGRGRCGCRTDAQRACHRYRCDGHAGDLVHVIPVLCSVLCGSRQSGTSEVED